MQSDIKKVKGLGAARNGLNHWWLQRLTAFALSVYAFIDILSSLKEEDS